MTKSNHKGFSLVEVVVAVALVGGVLAMIMGAVVMLNRAVANERVVAFTLPTGTSAQQWAYQDLSNVVPSFTNAPSRLADAQAEALWRELRDLYEQSYAVAAMDKYLLVDFLHKDGQGQVSPQFIGAQGFLSADIDAARFPPLTQRQLTGFDSTQPGSLYAILNERFGPGSKLKTFAVWNPAVLGIDMDSLRQATVFFIGGPQDRILAILRLRAWQFASSNPNPYRYYEVNLVRLRWEMKSKDGVDKNWRIDSSGAVNFVQDYSYRFTEDRRFPQDLIFPPTSGQLSDWTGDANTGNLPKTDTSVGRNVFIRLAKAGEDYATTVASNWDTNMNPGASRQQVSFVPESNNVSQLRAPVDEWHLILPDPSLSQAEDRAALRVSVATGGSFNATLDQGFRRQGKYGTTLSVYP